LLKNRDSFSIYRKVSVSEALQTSTKKLKNLKSLQKEKGSVPGFIGTDPLVRGANVKWIVSNLG